MGNQINREYSVSTPLVKTKKNLFEALSVYMIGYHVDDMVPNIRGLNSEHVAYDFRKGEILTSKLGKIDMAALYMLQIVWF